MPHQGSTDNLTEGLQILEIAQHASGAMAINNVLLQTCFLLFLLFQVVSGYLRSLFQNLKMYFL